MTTYSIKYWREPETYSPSQFDELRVRICRTERCNKRQPNFLWLPWSSLCVWFLKFIHGIINQAFWKCPRPEHFLINTCIVNNNGRRTSAVTPVKLHTHFIPTGSQNILDSDVFFIATQIPGDCWCLESVDSSQCIFYFFFSPIFFVFLWLIFFYFHITLLKLDSCLWCRYILCVVLFTVTAKSVCADEMSL